MADLDLKSRAVEIEGLVKSAQDGDHDSFAALYDILIDPIYRYVYYRVNGGDVEDIVETVFLKVWENLKRYRLQKNKSFSAWVFRIAHNLVVDHYRVRSGAGLEELSPNLPDQSREHNPIRSTQSVLDSEVLKRAIGGLKKKYRDVVIYKFINEFSNKEIAEIMNKSEGGLRILQFRALQALKKELKDLGFSVTYL